MNQHAPRLPFDEGDDSLESRLDERDRAARARAVDPRFNVALEASAGTGKTRVLVDRYLNLLKAGVDPVHILAVTFTRKAATEMRERILSSLRVAAERGEIPATRWRELRDRTGDIAVSTIDAFCLSLLREFPLEAGLDPGFSMAEETEVPRLIDESLDRALRACRTVAREDENVALVFAQLGDRRAKAGLAALLSRRLVAPEALRRYLAQGPPEWTVATVAARGASALRDVVGGMRGGLAAFLGSGPAVAQFQLLARHLQVLGAARGEPTAAAVHAAFARARLYFLTQEGTARKTLPRAAKKSTFRSKADYERHRDLVIGHAPSIVAAYASYRRDLNALVARGVWRMYAIAERQYRATLDAHAVLDFPDVLLYTLKLLGQMEEFSQSRYRLESRYHHVLVDEFQDTSRAQWELVSLLVRAWGEGAGLAYQGPLEPTVFIVGDRKQSIYGFRDADVAVLGEAGRAIAQLRPGGDVRRSISRSFRSVPALLAFVNDVCADIDKLPERTDAFTYGEDDLFPVAPPSLDSARDTRPHPALGLVAGPDVETCAATTAAEIAALVHDGVTIRDRDTGVPRPIRPGDVAILFRTRESHREFEDALALAGLPSYVYKGLGFFDADEIKDVLALLWYLAEPGSDLRAAAFLRSRFVRLSDEALRRLAPGLADALADSVRRGGPSGPNGESAAPPLEAADAARLAAARASSARWRARADRMPPAELVDLILHESAYGIELRGARFQQARENLKKFRALLRRIQNRGYSTLGRIASHLDRLAVGDESNASLDATNAVNLMTVHAAKGLEFPVVFLVNLARGTGNRRDYIRIGGGQSSAAASVAVGDFVSEYDEDAQAREREETKRLLYVALTRARDRLYLSSVLKEGRLVAGRGSLAEVLPPTLLDCFAMAAAGLPAEWRAASGQSHAFRAAGPATTQVDPAFADVREPDVRGPGSALSEPGDHDDLDVLDAVPSVRRATDVDMATGEGAPAAEASGSESERVLGTVVHRLLQALGTAPGASAEDAPSMALRLLRPDEAAGLADREAFAARAASVYQALCAHPEVRSLYAAADILHEVPFALRQDGAVVRGSIDCLVRLGPADVTVLEFKTGRPRPEHTGQVALYASVAERLFPGATVVPKLIYTDVGPDSPRKAPKA
ncbi:MAG TPA: UvrD-helicase domain-containing protein [Vicinamibacterales bacterium]|jgi:ATP-dependent helicase/nuclease subunit A|nr:UvrD-helicase domain-containing protein [Vicinamibacterales bacterium]